MISVLHVVKRTWRQKDRWGGCLKNIYLPQVAAGILCFPPPLTYSLFTVGCYVHFHLERIWIILVRNYSHLHTVNKITWSSNYTIHQLELTWGNSYGRSHISYLKVFHHWRIHRRPLIWTWFAETTVELRFYNDLGFEFSTLQKILEPLPSPVIHVRTISEHTGKKRKYFVLTNLTDPLPLPWWTVLVDKSKCGSVTSYRNTSKVFNRFLASFSSFVSVISVHTVSVKDPIHNIFVSK